MFLCLTQYIHIAVIILDDRIHLNQKIKIKLKRDWLINNYCITSLIAFDGSFIVLNYAAQNKCVHAVVCLFQCFKFIVE